MSVVPNDDYSKTQSGVVQAGQPAPSPVAPNAPTFAGQDPNQSPAYLAYLRGAGLDEQQARAAVTRQKANLGAQLEAQRPVWAQTLEQGTARILNNAANKGTVRSGRRLEDQALYSQDVGRQQAAFEGDIANKQGTLEEQLQSTLLQLQRGRAEAGLTAQQDLYANANKEYENDLQNYYLQMLLGG